MDAAEFSEYEKTLKLLIRDVPNYPKEGIFFKDITPLLGNSEMTGIATDLFIDSIHNSIEELPDAVAGVESRGFLFGMLLAQYLNVPFIPIRKAGKLPFHKVSKSYQLEYGEATIEMHKDAFEPGMSILIHDDLLATAGTACASAELIKEHGGLISGFAFLIELEFLNGRKKLLEHSDKIITLLKY